MFFIQRPRSFPHLLTPIFSRLTFPGGVNMWRWKHLHNARAREKERGFLQQEKQLYRIRFRIRTTLSGARESDSESDSNTRSHGRMNPAEHIKERDEALWDQNDGPLKSSSLELNKRPASIGPNQWPGFINSPIHFRKPRPDGRHLSNCENVRNGYNYAKDRYFSVQIGTDLCALSNEAKPFALNSVQKQRRNESFSSDDGSDYGFVNNSAKHSATDLVNKAWDVRNSRDVSDYIEKRAFSASKPRTFHRIESSPSVDDSDFESDTEDGVRCRRNVRVIGSRAALGKYDVKITKRLPRQEPEKEIDFAQEVELHELGKKKLAGNEVEVREHGEEKSFLGQKRFDDCCISPLTVKALTAAGYVQMTRVQEAALSVCLEGKDALVKAKTGTGKSLAFLLPAIEAVLKATSCNAKPLVNPIYVLILCPTRELASQTAAEANALLKYHDCTGVQTLVGGTRFKVDQKHLESDPCQIIIATPGRLLDHIENKGGLSVHLMGLKMLILDEADHLLDLGFRRDIEKIIDCLPRQRQTLLFSARIPKEVRRISQLVLKREHAFIDAMGLGSVETHDKVKQSFVVVPQEMLFQVVHHVLKEHILQAPDYKVMIFCTTGMVASLMYLLLQEMKINVREMHSRKPQLYRTRMSDEFRASKRLVLVTSDVSSRGMNYPNVTLVIQVGVPSDREQYIYRLGRTGREGKYGEGILLLAPWEEYFLDLLKDLPLVKFPVPRIDLEAKLKMEDSMSKIDSSVKEAACHAWLGYYNSIREIGRDKTTLVELAHQFCQSIGLQNPPPLFRKTAIKMGLKDIPGIRVRR